MVAKVVLTMLAISTLLLGIKATSSQHDGTYTSTIINAYPRTDVNGDIMDIHDGNILLYNGTYYYFGASYGNCIETPGPNGCANVNPGVSCGFQYNHNISLWTSDDLVTWHPSPNQPVFQMAKHFPVTGILFSPKVIFNPRTNLWLLWFNYAGNLAVVSSTTPYGPFDTVISTVVTSITYGGNDDFSFIIEEKSLDVYMLYNGHNSSGQEVMTVEKLDYNYTGGLGPKYNSGDLHPARPGVGDQDDVEATAFWYLNGLYYATWGVDCCYCQGGAAVQVFTSTLPLGPYTYMTTISSAIPAQQTTGGTFYDAKGNPHILWRGDMWQSAPDGIKGHDITYMGVLEFDPITKVPKQLVFLDSFEISVGPGPSDYYLIPENKIFDSASASNENAITIPSVSSNCSAIVNNSLPVGAIQPGSVYSFDSTALNSTTNYIYMPPVTKQQPWAFSGPAGVALTGSPFDPAPPIKTPTCPSYAFLQTLGNQSTSKLIANIEGLTVGNSYSVAFTYGVRSGSTQLGQQSNGALTQSQLTILFVSGKAGINWKSRTNLVDSGGWMPVITPSLIANSQEGYIVFTVESSSDEDHSILITDVLISVTKNVSID